MFETLLIVIVSMFIFVVLLGLGGVVGFLFSVMLFSGSKMLLLFILIFRIVLVQEKSKANELRRKHV